MESIAEMIALLRMEVSVLKDKCRELNVQAHDWRTKADHCSNAMREMDTELQKLRDRQKILDSAPVVVEAFRCIDGTMIIKGKPPLDIPIGELVKIRLVLAKERENVCG